MKRDTFAKALVLIIAVMVLYYTVLPLLNGTNDTEIEGFTGDSSFVQTKPFETHEGDSVYDAFYSKIYDQLTFNDAKVDYEINEMLRATQADRSKANILDVGCGTGSHCAALKEKGFKVQGVDKSADMVNRARLNYDGVKFSQGDVMTPMQFEHGKFSHILCMYFTIYYIQNKQQFFENCYNWLKPGGFLVLHLVDREKFNPILPVADPLLLVSPQKYAKERLTKSLVKFNGFNYKADFKLNAPKNKATFEETLKDDKTSHVRKNIHEFYMEPQEQVLSLAKQAGFIVKGKIDLMPVQYDHQYLYLLYRPN
jgi:2-polyprenyl-3-methyl-5-hydroxy-6-metoxy-1,4-benzoquinol methylase